MLLNGSSSFLGRVGQRVCSLVHGAALQSHSHVYYWFRVSHLFNIGGCLFETEVAKQRPSCPTEKPVNGGWSRIEVAKQRGPHTRPGSCLRFGSDGSLLLWLAGYLGSGITAHSSNCPFEVNCFHWLVCSCSVVAQQLAGRVPG